MKKIYIIKSEAKILPSKYLRSFKKKFMQHRIKQYFSFYKFEIKRADCILICKAGNAPNIMHKYHLPIQRKDFSSVKSLIIIFEVMNSMIGIYAKADQEKIIKPEAKTFPSKYLRCFKKKLTQHRIKQYF